MIKCYSLLLLISVFFFSSSCVWNDTTNSKAIDEKYAADIDSFLTKNGSSLKLVRVYKDSMERAIDVSYTKGESDDLYSNDILNLQKFLKRKSIPYNYIVAANEDGNYSLFDKTTFRKHDECRKTVYKMFALLEANKTNDLPEVLDKSSLNVDKTIQLFQFIGPVSSAKIVQYKADFDNFYGTRHDRFMICLNSDIVIKLVISYETTNLISVCRVEGYNSVDVQNEIQKPFDILSVPVK